MTGKIGGRCIFSIDRALTGSFWEFNPSSLAARFGMESVPGFAPPISLYRSLVVVILNAVSYKPKLDYFLDDRKIRSLGVKIIKVHPKQEMDMDQPHFELKN